MELTATRRPRWATSFVATWAAEGGTGASTEVVNHLTATSASLTPASAPGPDRAVGL